MPSAAPDEFLVERFRRDLRSLLVLHPDACGARHGIALSGGPDSLALLLLAHAAYPGVVAALTVDHGLRADAATEADAAGALCATLGIPHDTIRVVVSGSVQAAARAARYEALAAWAERDRLATVLTAHHADDQAETVLMRLARGAGLTGLSGIRATRRLADGTWLCRPLLGWRKAELESIVAAAGIAPARDPSNDDPHFDRTAARALLIQADWLDPARLAASAAHLADADSALGALTDERYAIIEDGEEVRYAPDRLPELARRHLRRLLSERFGAHPDGPMLERALGRLSAGGSGTCADVLYRAEPAMWHFRRAPPRRTG